MIQKIISYPVLFIVVIIASILSIQSVHASSVLPDSITLKKNGQELLQKGSVDIPAFEAGMNVELDIKPSAVRLLPGSKFEIGVAREIQRGYLTYYETFTSKNYNAEEISDLVNVAIPNITDNQATSTFVVYAKVYVSDNPDSEKFFVSESFRIIPSDLAFIAIQNVNILQSNGQRFELLAGPHIYNPALEKDQRLATSTNLEITFVSNTETVLNPVISFSKLRSDALDTVIEVAPIQIKKGENYIVVPLPQFEYLPGVYTGEMVFDTQLLPNSIKFQYIVAGDAVTVGQALPRRGTDGTEITFEIFGTPVDLNRLAFDGTRAELSQLYDVELVYIANGKEVYRDIQKVDFSTSSFMSFVPGGVKTIDSVEIVVRSESGAVVYEGSKDILVSIPGTVPFIMVISIVLLLVMTLVLIIIKKKYGTLPAVAVVLLCSSFIAIKSTEATWDPSSYLVAFNNSVFRTEQASEYPRLYFSDNLSTKQFVLGENLSFMFKMSYIYCDNTDLGLQAGFSTAGLADAIATKVDQVKTAAEQVSFGNTRGHPVFRNTTSFVRANLGPIQSLNTNLHAVVYHDIVAAARFATDGYSHYTIPLNIVPQAPDTDSDTPSDNTVPPGDNGGNPPGTTGGGCPTNQIYCPTRNSCIGRDEICPIACGVVDGTKVPADQRLQINTPGLCSSNYSVLVGSLFGTAGRVQDAWQWVCATSESGYTPRLSCSADCASGTTYCPATNSCAESCSTCPAGHTLDATGECIPADGKIIYFRAQPNTSATSCPVYWDTEVGDGAYMSCTIGSVAVDADNLVENKNGYPIQPGTRTTLTCEVRAQADDSLIRTVTSSTRCFKPTNVIEN